MKVLLIAFGHPDNVLSLARGISGAIHLRLVFVVSGDLYQEGILHINLEELPYGLTNDKSIVQKILPEPINRFIGNSFELNLIRTYDWQFFKDRKLRNFRLIRKAVSELKTEDFDVIHFNGTGGLMFHFNRLFRNYSRVWTNHHRYGTILTTVVYWNSLSQSNQISN